MSFDFKKFFVDIFDPQPNDVVTIMYDLPNGNNIKDNENWIKRREMATNWRSKINSFADEYRMGVNPILTYFATGINNGELPANGLMNDISVLITDVVEKSTIVLCMPEFSASAPLLNIAKKIPTLRIGSMPGVIKEMEETALSAEIKTELPVLQVKALTPLIKENILK